MAIHSSTEHISTTPHTIFLKKRISDMVTPFSSELLDFMYEKEPETSCFKAIPKSQYCCNKDQWAGKLPWMIQGWHGSTASLLTSCMTAVFFQPVLFYFYCFKMMRIKRMGGLRSSHYGWTLHTSEDNRSTFLPFLFSLSPFSPHCQPMLGGI